MGLGKPNEVLEVKSPERIVIELSGGFRADFVGISLLVPEVRYHIWICIYTKNN
jgi:hypothetical protein